MVGTRHEARHGDGPGSSDKTVSSLNPLTYEVDGLRSLMLREGQTTFGLAHDLAALLVAFALMVTIATRMYPRMTE